MNGSEQFRLRKGKPIAVCLLCVFILLACALFLFTACDFLFKTEIYLKNFSMEIELGEDGSMTVTETAKAYFSSQDTDWYNFYRIIDNERALDHPEIDGESFKLDGKRLEFVGYLNIESHDASYWKREYRNRAVGYYCASSNGLELGIVMPPFESGTHTFSYTYKLPHVVTEARDTDVFYYKYVSEINTMDIKEMDVTVLFPKAEPNLQAWLHVSKNAVGAWKAMDGNVGMTIHVEDVKNGEYIETRALLGKGNYETEGVASSMTSVDIENEETEWYEKYKRKQTILLTLTILDYVIAVLAIAAAAVYTVFLKKSNKPFELPDAPIYYRDIPEGYTGGEVSPLYFYYSNENYLDESISATMLELVRLRYITISPDVKSKSARIVVLKRDEDDALRSHQKFVLDTLLLVKPMGESFTMKEFEKFGKEHTTQMLKFVDQYKAAILNKSQREGAYQKRNPIKEKGQKFASVFVGIGILGVVLSGFANFILGFGMFFASAGFLIASAIPYLVIYKSKPFLTVSGQKEYDKLHALARFMQEFSNMDDHEIPELAMWEDYMVFATAMGIADKVAEQLEIKYPEFKTLSETNFDIDNFVILYFFSRSFRSLSGLNFIGNVANVVHSVEVTRRAMKAAEIAKKYGGGGGRGFGGGGGFHGGGGGFSGGGFGGRR